MDFLGHNWLNDTPPYSDTEIKAWFETHTKVASFRGGGYADKMGNLRDVVACLSEPQREEVANAIEVSENFNPGWVQGEPHVSRLLTHSNAPACYQFALAMIRHPEYKSHVPPSLDGFEAFIFGRMVHTF